MLYRSCSIPFQLVAATAALTLETWSGVRCWALAPHWALVPEVFQLATQLLQMAFYVWTGFALLLSVARRDIEGSYQLRLR